ncbi:NAD(P)H:quinone oxidoreductase [Paenibacillus sp. N4]|uniref:NAD(P)H:quinone oxidoreductase n=1 Tax=Paenibacillus vietnamensis TaxID=2590547 RepID=UPI001CD061C7|nr:NAD(P)H:quinone oxidoreductase [Paenibacillus vietnamensis]MCA0757438.1 NAD(P)H:quinone oxidoreductase [Paenibacillus vietnamensis]
MTVKLAIIYYSQTGTNYRMARAAEDAAIKHRAEVRLVRAAEVASKETVASNPAWEAHAKETEDVPLAVPEDLEWADAILFGTPTRFGSPAAQLRQFIDSTGKLWAKGKLADKAVSAFTSAQNPHGGQEATLLNLYTTFYHWGAVVVTPGYTDPVIFQAGGNPYGASATVTEDGKFDDLVLDAVKVQTKRLLDIAERLKA